MKITRQSSTKTADHETVIMRTILLLSAALPFIVPFNIGRSIDTQAIVLVLMGIIAAGGLYGSTRQILKDFDRLKTATLCIYLASCFLSIICRHGLFANLVGEYEIRLGTLGLLSCVGCGLVLRSVGQLRLLHWLYATDVLLAITAIPYNLLKLHSLARVGGAFQQADILAVFMGCGLLLSPALWRAKYVPRQLLIASQIVLAVILVMTRTRAIIALTVLLLIIMLWHASLRRLWKIAFTVGMVMSVTLISLAFAGRLSSGSYASTSTSYRLSLQQAGLVATVHRPIAGYGAGHISTALSCVTLHTPALLKTCRDGYYFNSSHNIYLDRFLALGWLGGISFIVFVVTVLLKRQSSGPTRYFRYAATLIALYYLTNVTSIAVELLFWVLLCSLIPVPRHAHSTAKARSI